MDRARVELVEIRRGAIVEARHRGAIVAVEPGGRIVASLGDPSTIICTRSSIKPIQAIPVIVSGAADRFDITSQEMAVICASHSGELRHTETVLGLLAKIGLSESDLQCGAHRPFSEEAASQLDRDGRAFSVVHNNCSGKHAGMLATAAHLGAPIEDYLSPEHPVQRGIVSTLAKMTGSQKTFVTAMDGCSAPTFAMPLVELAIAFSRLVNPWSFAKPEADPVSPAMTALRSDEAVAIKWIVAAMTSNPDMVGGSRGRLDTDLIRVARGKLISKVGAEAVHAIGVLPCEQFPRGLGMAIKIEDGAQRAAPPVVIEALAQLGVLDQSEQDQLANYHRPVVKNHKKIKVGEICAVFDLRYG
ncbi:MAG TPA: asparaginase [Blastocatellia bacterium]|nr:asparaginase [Blastocatellia bacterium]